MSDFSLDIRNFQRYGTYTYTFDNVGNSIFDSSSVNFNQVYMAFPLQNVVYDNSKIKTMYVVDFQEFIPQTSTPITSSVLIADLQQQIDVIQQENDTLKTQLDGVISQSDSSSSAADKLAVKQVILQLRKAVGQGRVDSDFSDTFPYTPIIKPTT